MQSFVCSKFLGKYLIASRFDKRGLVISQNIFSQLLLLAQNNSYITESVIELFGKLGFEVTKTQKINDIVLVKQPWPYSFGRASYEITEKCNYRCQHCYLGNKSAGKKLTLSDKKKIIELVHKSGCLWLQLTGGEPFLDKDFIEIYSLAHSLGLLVTISSNGSLLSPEIKEVLKNYPPYRLTISMYGASNTSYEALTQITGSYHDFTSALKWLENQRIRVRLNIIQTKYNAHEIEEMKKIAREFGFEHIIYSSLIPTLDGKDSPLSISCQDEDCNEKKESSVNYIPCQAGINSFHIDSSGQVSICKMARQLNCDLSLDHDIIVERLKIFSSQLLESPSICSDCQHRKSCSICPPVFRLYSQCGNISAACKIRQKKERRSDHEAKKLII